MKEGMNGTHASSNTDILLEVHTVRSGHFKVIGLLESFHFSLCSSVFQFAMSGNIFKGNMCICLY